MIGVLIALINRSRARRIIRTWGESAHPEARRLGILKGETDTTGRYETQIITSQYTFQPRHLMRVLRPTRATN